MKTKNAFTVVELILVIVVLVVVVFLALPRWTTSHDNANIAVCANNLKYIGISLHDYYLSKGRKRYYPHYSVKDGETYVMGSKHHPANSAGRVNLLPSAKL